MACVFLYEIFPFSVRPTTLDRDRTRDIQMFSLTLLSRSPLSARFEPHGEGSVGRGTGVELVEFVGTCRCKKVVSGVGRGCGLRTKSVCTAIHIR